MLNVNGHYIFVYSPHAIVYLLIEFTTLQLVTEMEGERILIFTLISLSHRLFQRELLAPEDINIWETWPPYVCSLPIHYCLFIYFSHPTMCVYV